MSLQLTCITCIYIYVCLCHYIYLNIVLLKKLYFLFCLLHYLIKTQKTYWLKKQKTTKYWGKSTVHYIFKYIYLLTLKLYTLYYISHSTHDNKIYFIQITPE